MLIPITNQSITYLKINKQIKIRQTIYAYPVYRTSPKIIMNSIINIDNLKRFFTSFSKISGQKKIHHMFHTKVAKSHAI